MLKLNNMLLNTQWFKEKIIREIRKWRWMKINIQYTKMYGCNESRTQGKFIAINVYFKKEERS